MATSSSNSPDQGDWTVEVDLFSGLPNPVWALSAAQVSDLLEIWNGLEPAGDAASEPFPRLGYRGFTVAAPHGDRWTAAAGVVTQAAGLPTPKREPRSDP